MHREFQRTYKACEACRKRKSRCDLGGDDQTLFAFSGPPCAYCRRTRRECVLRDERNTVVPQRPGHRLASSSTKEARKPPRKSDRPTGADSQRVPAHSDQNGGLGFPRRHEEDNPIQPSEETGIGFLTSNPGTLGSASQQLDTSRVEGSGGQPKTSIAAILADGDGQIVPSPTSSRNPNDHRADIIINTVVSKGSDYLDILSETPERPRHLSPKTADHPSSGRSQSVVELSPANAETLSIWRSCKFAKMGLLTAEQLVTYVDAFFLNLAPRSPVLNTHFAEHKNHRSLLFREPLLCLTILMISTRYHTIPGVRSTSQSQFIHDELWDHVQRLIQLINIGEGQGPGHSLRSVGSIEALLLLSEWYSRKMQFSGSSHVWDMQLTSTDDSLGPSSNSFLEHSVEPSRRFDRMSWMFLGTAQVLAHELGVFKEHTENESEAEPSSLRSRYARVRELLFIYLTLHAARLGLHSMIMLTFNPGFLSRVMEPTSSTIAAWIDLIKLTKTIHAAIFSSGTITRDLVKNGNYIELLEHFDPLLYQWQHRYLECQDDEVGYGSLGDLLVLEYLTVRMYTNSPALQAFALRDLSEDRARLLNPVPGAHVHPQSGDPGQQPERRFAQVVIRDAHQIVIRVVDMARTGVLLFHPARTFQRFISACIFLLKAHKLGFRRLELQDGSPADDLFNLLQQSVQALRLSAVDDTHLATHYATLLEYQLTHLQDGIQSAKPNETSTQTRTTESSNPDRTVNGSEEWQAGFGDPFSELDIFTDWTVFDELGNL